MLTKTTCRHRNARGHHMQIRPLVFSHTGAHSTEHEKVLSCLRLGACARAHPQRGRVALRRLEGLHLPAFILRRVCASAHAQHTHARKGRHVKRHCSTHGAHESSILGVGRDERTLDYTVVPRAVAPNVSAHMCHPSCCSWKTVLTPSAWQAATSRVHHR